MDGTINENITIEGTGAGGNSKKRASEGGGDHKKSAKKKKRKGGSIEGKGGSVSAEETCKTTTPQTLTISSRSSPRLSKHDQSGCSNLSETSLFTMEEDTVSDNFGTLTTIAAGVDDMPFCSMTGTADDNLDDELPSLGTTTKKVILNTAVTTANHLDPLKEEIWLVPKHVVLAMIAYLAEEDDDDIFAQTPVELLRCVLPHLDYFVKISEQLDPFFMFVDDNFNHLTITEYVRIKFSSLNESQSNSENRNSRTKRNVDITNMWVLIHALQVNSRTVPDFNKISPPSIDIPKFYHSVLGFFRRAMKEECQNKTDTDNHKQSPTKTRAIKKKGSDSVENHHNESRQGVVFEGKHYNCNAVKVTEDGSIKTYIKYFQCAMVFDRSDGSKWKAPSEVRKGKKMKSAQPLLTKCSGTMKGYFTTKHGKETQQFLPGKKPHICHNLSLADSDTVETRVQLIVLHPSPSWNLDSFMINNMKEVLSKVESKWWINQNGCKTDRQYLKELSSAPKLEMVRKQAEAMIRVYMTNFVTRFYKSLTHFRVGALRSKGDNSQYDLQGTLHRDYEASVNTKVPDERPQSIIVALDPFNIIYESGIPDTNMQTAHLYPGQAIVFPSSLRHAGGSNGITANRTYKYCVFAYIVSEESDFPSEVGTRLNVNK